MITIHQKSSSIEVGINQGSIRRYNLMKEDFIKLKFSLTSNVPLLIGDYVDLTDNGYNEDGTTTLFKLDRNYYPTFNENTGGWDYDVQFNAHYHLWKNKVLMFNPEKGAAESSFSLTDTIQTHVGLLVSNLEYANFTYDGKYYKAEIDDELEAKGMKPITYSAVTMYGALYLIAQAYECEWWVVGNTIHFGYRKDERFNYTLTLHEEIANVNIGDSDGVHATRIYAFGGTTNVPKHYRDKLLFTADTLWYDGGVVKGVEDGTRKVTSDMFRGTKKQMAPKLYTINQGVSSTGELGLNVKEPKVSETRQDINLEAQSYTIDLNNLTIDFAVSHFSSSTESTGLIEVEKSLTLHARVMLVNGVDFSVVSEETRTLTHGNGKPTSTFTFEGMRQAQPKFTPTELVIQLSVLEAKWRYVKYEGDVVTNDEWRYFSLLEYAFTNEQTILTIQKDAKSVDTTIFINGGSKEYNATINPDFVDNGGHILVNDWEGRVEDIKTYQFPKIVINKVPPKHFTAEDGCIQTGVVQKNLMLPEGVNYVQADGVDDSDVVEAIMVYDWIYPKTELAITNVEPFHDWNVEVEDGEDYKVTTYDITLPIADYENALWVDPSQMYAIFQKGYAAGLRFELNLVKQTKTDVTFRLVPNEDYQTWIPNEATKPAIGDTLILEGIDISFIDSTLIAQAEEKVLEQAQKDIIETSKEDKVVDITLSPEYALKTGRIALGAYTSLVDVLSSEGGAYDSRVLGFEECLDIPWDRPKYIIGERNYYNRTASIETKLNNIEKGSITLSGVNVGGSNASPIRIIRAKDATEPSDKNVYSAIRSREEFAKRKEEETFSEKVTFEKGIEAKGETKVGALSATRVKANTASFNDATAKNLTSEEVSANHITIGGFVEQGDIIQGAQVTKDGIASFAKVKTPSMQVYELTLNRKTAVQGEYVFSDGETIEEVTQRDDSTYQLRVREPYEGYVTTFKVDDILYSNINMLDAQAHTGKCWMFATAVNGSTITAKMYPAEQCPSGENIAPIPHMTITRHGNRTDETRQDLFVISSETSSLTMLRGVNAPIVSSEGLYGVVLGKLPSTLLDYIKKGGYEYVNSEDPYIYARGVIVQDLIMLDYQGKPIRQETYRGHWSAEIAKSDPYQSSLTAYDTATHNGSLWQCMLAGTTAEPKEGIADWLIKIAKGDDATASIYELVPSANIIYYRTAEKTLSVNSLDVKVGETTAHGYVEIADQYILEERGLKVSYAIDGKGDRTDLNISPVAAYLLEDGTAILATEDGFGLSLEGEDIDINAIEDNITLYLTDTTTDEDRATYVIPVVKDGSQVGNNILLNSAFEEFEGEGESNMLKYWDMTSDMAMLILSLKDLDGIYNAARVLYGGIKQYVSLTDKRSYTFSVYVNPTPTAQIVYRTNTNSDVVITSKQGTIKETVTDTNKVITFTPDVPSNEYTLVSMTIHATNYASQDTIELTASSGGALYACPKLEEGSVATTYSKAVSELTGKAGERGRMLYPAGDYSDNVIYKIENNSAPFVREGETYYVLEWEEGEVVGIKPSEDYAKNGGHWKPFTYMNYLFAEFLMAKWAHFGSNNGAVFYDRYLFSQQGNVLDDYGYLSEEDASYGGYKDKMFNEDGNLANTKFIPNVSINFATGDVDTSRLNERYYPCSSAKVVRIGRVHNIVVTPQAGRVDSNYEALNRFGGSGPLVILPQDGLTTGAHLSIVARNDERYLTAFLQDSESSYNILGANYLVSAFALVSVDNILSNQNINDGDIGGNYIMYRGMRTKYVMLAPNYTLNLRLEIVTYLGKTYNFWHIENSNDFVKINSQIFETSENFDGVSINYDSHNIYVCKYADNVGYSENWKSTQEGYSPIMVASNIFSNYNGNNSVLGRNTPDIILSTNKEDGLCYGYYYRLVDGRGTSGDMNFSPFYNEQQ